MKGLQAVLRRIQLEQKQNEAAAQRKHAAAQEMIERLISKGPPAASGINFEVWRTWHRLGYVVCPASKLQRTCSRRQCGIGADCRQLRALGLAGNRMPLPQKKRPLCGARNRRGKPCAVRVEPGKRRCRFHGGLSTGPKTAAGRERIAEAQRRRWRALSKPAKRRSR